MDPVVVEHELKDILSAPEYNKEYAREPDFAWLVRVLDAIAEFLDRTLGGLSFERGVSDLATFILAWLVVIAFAVLLALIIRKMGSRARAGADSSEDQAPDYELPSARPLIAQAARLANEGDYKGAFRCAYLASISHLDEINALHFERSRTNWEYMRELEDGGHDVPHAQLRPLTADFDRKFYGRERVQELDYASALAAYERISREEAA